MRAPGFWSREPGILSSLLAPVAFAYGAVAARRLGRDGRTAPVPVLCIGNVTLGGAGKTPVAIEMARLAREIGRHPAFLTRGYGGRLAGPLLVDEAHHSPEEVGDEPLLLARHAPTIVARERPLGAEQAQRSGADLIVMDDGLQNPSLRKDLTLAVFDGEAGIGNGRVFPAGPLRAPMRAQWRLIDAVVIMGRGAAAQAIEAEGRRRSRPVFQAELRASQRVVRDLGGARALAFAGIGRPAKFFRTCRECGLEVAAERPFPDHHRFTARELGALLDEAERGGLVPITTEKDLVRLRPLLAAEPRLCRVRTLPVRARFEDEAGLRDLMEARLGPVRPACSEAPCRAG